jgi:hypothetical protein
MLIILAMPKNTSSVVTMAVGPNRPRLAVSFIRETITLTSAIVTFVEAALASTSSLARMNFPESSSVP